MTRYLTVAPSALHTLAADYRGHSTELAAHAADLAAIGGQVDVFGPVGAAFAAGTTLIVEAHLDYRDESGLASYQCRIAADGEEFASARLSVYEPDDFAQFLSQNDRSR